MQYKSMLNNYFLVGELARQTEQAPNLCFLPHLSKKAVCFIDFSKVPKASLFERNLRRLHSPNPVFTSSISLQDIKLSVEDETEQTL